jgi:hypothetical protein
MQQTKEQTTDPVLASSSVFFLDGAAGASPSFLSCTLRVAFHRGSQSRVQLRIASDSEHEQRKEGPFSSILFGRHGDGDDAPVTREAGGSCLGNPLWRSRLCSPTAAVQRLCSVLFFFSSWLWFNGEDVGREVLCETSRVDPGQGFLMIEIAQEDRACSFLIIVPHSGEQYTRLKFEFRESSSSTRAEQGRKASISVRSCSNLACLRASASSHDKDTRSASSTVPGRVSGQSWSPRGPHIVGSRGPPRPTGALERVWRSRKASWGQAYLDPV